MANASPPKPWEKQRDVSVTPTSLAEYRKQRDLRRKTSNLSPIGPSTKVDSAMSSHPTPTLPERPASLMQTVNRNASAYSSYASNRVAPPYSGMPSTYNNPYSRMGGVGYGGMGGVYGMGGMNGMGYGGMGNMYSGIGGMPLDPNDMNSLTHGLAQNTQATFQMIESIVGAFGGLAQMLESTYMATHSSFFAMISVAEQFGNLKNTLGSILGIFTLLRWLRTMFARLTGQPPPPDAIKLTPGAFARFERRRFLPDGTPAPQSRPSKTPFFFFIAAAFGLPYLMGKLIKALAASQDEEQRHLVASGQVQVGPDGQLLPQPIDPSKLDFCRALFDFTPESGATVKGVDLVVKKGDLVAVLSKSDPMGNPSEWWRCRARDGRVGYLPAAYLSVARPGKLTKRLGSVTNTQKVPGNPTTKPDVLSKAGDISVESFQKSQFHS